MQTQLKVFQDAEAKKRAAKQAAERKKIQDAQAKIDAEKAQFDFETKEIFRLKEAITHQNRLFDRAGRFGNKQPIRQETERLFAELNPLHIKRFGRPY